jgi:hypothetical protein
MANQNRSQLQATSQSNFPDNTSQLISPADLRQWITNGIDSFITQKDKSTLENAIYEAEGSALAASSTVDLSSATGNFLHITGAATISSFGTVTAGARFVLVFDGVCTLTYNATSLILPGTANITTAANDCCMIVSEGSGNWRVVGYFPIAGGGGGGTVTAVTATAPLASSGGSAPDISIPQANGTTDGFLDSADWTTFNGKQDVLSAGTGISIASNTVTNTAPDQVVALTAGTGIGITGTYPNFTIDNTSPGTMPGGADTEIQYNNGGTAFGGVSDLTWDDINNVLTIKNPRIGQSVGNGHFHMHTINASPPSGLVDYITFWVDKSPKQVGFRFEQDTYTSAFQFNATSDLIYTFPDLSGTVALLANPASFSSLTSTSSVTIGDASATTGTIVLHNATNANTLTLQSGTTSSSYTITMPPAASVGAQYLQSTGSGGTLQWTSGTTTGVSTVGAFSASPQTNGASIAGSVITFGPASNTVPGMISTVAQTIGGGTKTFNLPASTGTAISITGAGSTTTAQVAFSGSTMNWINFGVNGLAIPATGTRSAGTKIVIYPNIGPTTTDNAIGADGGASGGNLWISSPNSVGFYPDSSTAIAGAFRYASTVRGLNLTATGAATIPQMLINGTTYQWISFGAGNFGDPALTSGTRSAGTKIVLYSHTTLDNGFGVDGSSAGGNLWITTPNAIKFYTNGSTTVRAAIDSSALTLADAVNIAVNATTGTKIGTATNQKIAFWNKTPIVQPTTAITGAARVGGAGTTVTTTDTYGGYTIAQIAAALVNTGILA